MRNVLLSVLFATGFTSNMVFAADTLEMISGCREIPPEQMIDENYLGKNDWRKWQYRLSTEADLNKDGKNEKIWVIADISKNSNVAKGEDPWLYDDGAPWAVVIEAPNRKQTLVYLEWSQFGRIETIVVNEEENTNILIMNRQAASIGIYEVKYKKPNQYKVCQILERDVQSFAD